MATVIQFIARFLLLSCYYLEFIDTTANQLFFFTDKTVLHDVCEVAVLTSYKMYHIFGPNIFAQRGPKATI